MTRDVIRRLSHLCTLALCAGVFLCVVMIGAAVRPLHSGSVAGSRRWVAATPLFLETPVAFASGRDAGQAPMSKRTWRRPTSRRTVRTLMPRAHAVALSEQLVGVAAMSVRETIGPDVPRGPYLARRYRCHAPTRAPPALA